jgi:hypothetical protein
MISAFGTLKIMQDANPLVNTLLNISQTSVSIPTITSAFNTGTGSLVVGGGAGIGGDVYIGGVVNSAGYVNNLTTYTGAVSYFVHDLLLGTSFYHSGMTGNFTAAFLNVPTTNNREFEVTLFLKQGPTGYYADGVQINGTVELIRWTGIKTPSSNLTDVQKIRFVRVNNSWTILGQLLNYT